MLPTPTHRFVLVDTPFHDKEEGVEAGVRYA